jgi:CspA family cold shock protein
MGYSDGLTYVGRVCQWDEENGWGVVESASFRDPVWVHYSVVDPDSHGVLPGGFLNLFTDDEVEFTVERAEQDGYHWRALWVKSTKRGGDHEGKKG